jgi:hypothetical protein
VSDDTWDLAGPGVGLSAHDEATDGKPSTFKYSKGEPGTSRGPGSSAPREKSRNQRLYVHWTDAVFKVGQGRATRITVDPATWNRSIGKIRKQMPDLKDSTLKVAFGIFANDVLAERVGVEGKSCWWVFVSKWQHYVRHASSKSEAGPTSFEDSITNTW